MTDENIHLAATQLMIRLLKKEDPMFSQIAIDCHDEVQQMFLDAIKQEEDWADYLFEEGSIIGLNSDILKQYIQWIGSKRMGSVNIKCPYSVGKINPLPWTERWITSAGVQVAPQETEISSYVIGGIDHNMNKDSFKGMEL